MKTEWQKSQENAQVINSLSRTLDIVIEEQMRLDEQQKIYGENELQTCDIDDGGPWYWSTTGEAPSTATPKG